MDQVIARTLEQAKHRRLAECKTEIRALSHKALQTFHRIGSLLKEVCDEELWKIDGSTSFVEWAEAEIGYQKTFTYNLVKLARQFKSLDVEHGKLRVNGALEIAQIIEAVPVEHQEELKEKTIARIAEAPQVVDRHQARQIAERVAQELGIPVGERLIRAAPPISDDLIELACRVPTKPEAVFLDPRTGRTLKRAPRDQDGNSILDGMIVRIDLGPDRHLNVEISRRLRAWIARS